MFKNFFKPAQKAPPPLPPRDDLATQARELIVQGNAAEDAGRWAEAHELYLRAVSLAPALPEAHLNLGIAQEALGDAESARGSYGQVLALDAGNPFGGYNLAKLDYLQGRPEVAEQLLHAALARKPDFFNAWLLLSSVNDTRGDQAAAAHAIGQALKLQPEHVGALYNQARVLQRVGRLDEAEAAIARAADLDPGNVDCAVLHMGLLLAQGFAVEALLPLRRAIALAPHRFDLRSKELFILNLVASVDADDLARRHRELGAQVEAAVPARPQRAAAPTGLRLRIGYVSGDFRGHPVTMFLLPVLERRARERFEVFCYSSTQREDAFTRRVEQLADGWRDVRTLHDNAIADAVAADGIDLLVDLGGHSGELRLGVFVNKPAPVQLTWLGYLNTTGLTRMDFRLSDQRCDPPAVSQPRHSERLLYLPDSQWCFRPFMEVAAAPAAPCERNGYVTFGSFNNAMKLTREQVSCWGRLLAALPSARLLLADVSSARKREWLLETLREGGMAGGAERVEFAPRTDLRAYYELYARVDIALDSHPYGGGTTTFDALWMGVPVLAMTGELPASRSAASILAALGLGEWIAPDMAAFEAVAIERVRDTATISKLRRTLRARLQASAFMDEARFVAAFENLLLQAWRERIRPH